MTTSSPLSDRHCSDDDKYVKFAGQKGAPGALSKYYEALGAVSLRSVTDKDVAALAQSSFSLYMCFLMVVSVVYYSLGGSLLKLADVRSASVFAEAFGLLMLRKKIARQGNVSGISGMTMGMYALVYASRQVVNLPMCSWVALDDWALWVLGMVSFWMVLDVLRSVFVTFRSSYQEEHDVLSMKYMVPGCLILAALLRPNFTDGWAESYCWAVCLYMDVLALMPQVVMMSRGGGRVEAPVSHFVAATAVSRGADLWFWISSLRTDSFFVEGDCYSGVLIVFFHVFHLLLVADFVAHYLKARISGSALSDDLVLPTLDDVL